MAGVSRSSSSLEVNEYEQHNGSPEEHHNFFPVTSYLTGNNLLGRLSGLAYLQQAGRVNAGPEAIR